MSGQAKILVVDDDRELVEAVRMVLEGGGYKVVAAYSSEQGMAQLQAEKPDLILLDVMMPEATEGFHLVWKLRQGKDEYSRTVPIVIMTAIHEKTDLRFYPDSGDGTYQAGEYLPVQDFIDKPAPPDQLLERVERALRVWGKGGKSS